MYLPMTLEKISRALYSKDMPLRSSLIRFLDLLFRNLSTSCIKEGNSSLAKTQLKDGEDKMPLILATKERRWEKLPSAPPHFLVKSHLHSYVSGFFIQPNLFR